MRTWLWYGPSPCQTCDPGQTSVLAFCRTSFYHKKPHGKKKNKKKVCSFGVVTLMSEALGKTHWNFSWGILKDFIFWTLVWRVKHFTWSVSPGDTELSSASFFFVSFETIKWEINTRLIYECRCDEKLKVKTEGSRRLTYTGFRVGLDHLKIETRLIDERFASLMGECVIVTRKVRRLYSK
jgi:hypothetical protein